MNNPKQSLKVEFEKEFGKLNSRQLWAITKLAKFVRLRARNNVAFNNAMNEIFPHAKFRTVTKNRTPRFPGDSPTYPGLQISVAEIQVPATNSTTIPPETIDGDESEE